MRALAVVLLLALCSQGAFVQLQTAAPAAPVQSMISIVFSSSSSVNNTVLLALAFSGSSNDVTVRDNDGTPLSLLVDGAASPSGMRLLLYGVVRSTKSISSVTVSVAYVESPACSFSFRRPKIPIHRSISTLSAYLAEYSGLSFFSAATSVAGNPSATPTTSLQLNCPIGELVIGWGFSNVGLDSTPPLQLRGTLSSGL